MATVISNIKMKLMKSFRPSDEAREEINAALDNLNAVIKKNNCVAFIDMVCGELHVFKDNGCDFTVLDRDDGEPAGSIQCLGHYLSTGWRSINAEHDIVWAKYKKKS